MTTTTTQAIVENGQEVGVGGVLGVVYDDGRRITFGVCVCCVLVATQPIHWRHQTKRLLQSKYALTGAAAHKIWGRDLI